jgi:hypothetical protein
MLVDDISIALDFGRHFDALGVVWLVGGSVASSLLGEPRATDDVDLVADLRLQHVGPLCARLVEAYYVDEDVMRWAVKTRRTFNAIHFESTIKVDIYCSTNDALSRTQLERRLFVPIGGERIPVYSAEDIILRKLMWFEQGGRVSDRQWRDLLGVVTVHRGKLDRPYLDGHARDLGLTELLVKLLEATNVV